MDTVRLEIVLWIAVETHSDNNSLIIIHVRLTAYTFTPVKYLFFTTADALRGTRARNNFKKSGVKLLCSSQRKSKK